MTLILQLSHIHPEAVEYKKVNGIRDLIIFNQHIYTFIYFSKADPYITFELKIHHVFRFL